MKILSILVDELPSGCYECPLNDTSQALCVPMDKRTPFEPIDARRHDCLLHVFDESEEAGILMDKIDAVRRGT